MSQLPRLPEDEQEGAERTPLGSMAIAGLIIVILVVATMIVLHLTGVIEPTGH
jgi:hypothetical protein